MKKVVKFGGSSLASAEQFTKVKDIICSDTDRRYVVPSAPGKRFSGDTKVTDMLYTCYAAAEQDEDFSDKLAKIQARYNEIINGLGLTLSLDTQFEEIASKFAAKAGKEYAASRGEYLMVLLWQTILDMSLLMQQRLFVLITMVPLMQLSQTRSCLSALRE